MDGFKACFKPFLVSSFFIKRKEHSNRGYRKKKLFSTNLRRTFGCKRNRATLWIIRGAVYLKEYVISLVGGLQTSENSNHLIIKKATLELTHEFLRVCTGWWKWKLNTLEILNERSYRKNEFLSSQTLYTLQMTILLKCRGSSHGQFFKC